MELTYTAPAMIKLRLAEAIKEHSDVLIAKLKAKEITYEEFCNRSFPTNCFSVIEKAIDRSVELDGAKATMVDHEGIKLQLEALRNAKNS